MGVRPFLISFVHYENPPVKYSYSYFRIVLTECPVYYSKFNMDSFVKRVDGAMYKAKQGGRNRVEVL